MLTDIIPAAQRKLVYAVFGTIGLVLAVLQAAYLTQHTEPTWLVMALAAYGVASAGIHATASSNTAGSKRTEKGAINLLPVAVVVLLPLILFVVYVLAVIGVV